ncbi:hypothetical protein [Nonomuraea sp. NPDC050783]|uniref:hypothetical protein n=1 Tax=Nonomuraea sp. NPDC050783 TaxID=3154634 RepID=UPI003467BB01
MIRLLNQQEDGDPDGGPLPPAQPPELVRAARAHLTDRYATGVNRLFWQTRKQPMPDVEAITEAIGAASRGRAAEPDLASALVVVQALRLDVDRLEHRLLLAARAAGLDWAGVAAVLELPSAEAAERHFARLQRRSRQPADEVEFRFGPGTPPVQQAQQTGRRAERVAHRAHEAGERAQQVRRRWQDLVTWRPQPETEDGGA